MRHTLSRITQSLFARCDTGPSAGHELSRCRPIVLADGGADSTLSCKPEQRDRGYQMAIEYLRDDHFRIIGTIEAASDGKQIARDARHKRVGEYDPKADRTRDDRYRIVGVGNQLAALIWRTHE
ncbi:hypothetical protein [Burkholderia vietnamiensis]|uniref:hypothetical protein n=1 Tax=Burkholderia vietnamiensis TaxID=60552 RepID=UPI001E2B9CD5|nr:hypothetical protein [Burkholderia vietnamiensis]MDN8070204.1 hypothetical protein [Burkholderia vietnamiensis]